MSITRVLPRESKVCPKMEVVVELIENVSYGLMHPEGGIMGSEEKMRGLATSVDGWLDDCALGPSWRKDLLSYTTSFCHDVPALELANRGLKCLEPRVRINLFCSKLFLSVD